MIWCLNPTHLSWFFPTLYSPDNKLWLRRNLLPVQLCFTHKDTSCTSTSVIPSALRNHSLQERPGVKQVTGAKQVSKCDKSCWVLSSQFPPKKRSLVWKMPSSSTEDIVDLTTTLWLSFETTKKTCQVKFTWCCVGCKCDYTACEYMPYYIIVILMASLLTVNETGWNSSIYSVKTERGASWGRKRVKGDLLRHTGPDVQGHCQDVGRDGSSLDWC